MRVQDLIDELEGFNPDAEECISYQPGYPLCVDTNDIIAVSEDGLKVYIAQTSDGGNDYLPSEISGQLGWRG